ncbi:hypothetical protein [Arsenicicoccus dermatophilus]|uniref:hypothetical protein n=1 Tax=Arsenicicoccus dermatophilus TaxID=1076331 RepID=UPI001F4C6085|nr:hypothetical protein [Arsenicicoccus dermatophilus]MCH8613640.1 hypothetical protein [Arsenicicoccus dermatophilus]
MESTTIVRMTDVVGLVLPTRAWTLGAGRPGTGLRGTALRGSSMSGHGTTTGGAVGDASVLSYGTGLLGRFEGTAVDLVVKRSATRPGADVRVPSRSHDVVPSFGGPPV